MSHERQKLTKDDTKGLSWVNLEEFKLKGEGDDRGQDGWMASPTQ